MDTIEILEHVTVVQPDFHLWSGRRRLRAADLGLAESEVPAGLFSLGSKKICDPASLAELARLKARAERECAAAGTRFLAGYAVPNDRVGALAERLDAICAEFDERRARFLERYGAEVEAWAARHPAFAEPIRRAVPPRERVAEALSCGYHLYRVVPAAGAPAAGLDAEVEGLAETLYREIARAARRLHEGSVLGRSRVSRRALEAVRRIERKLEGLAFLDRRMRPLLDTLGQVLGALPARGALRSPRDITTLGALLMLLGDVEAMKRHGEGLLADPAGSPGPAGPPEPGEPPLLPGGEPGEPCEEDSAEEAPVPEPLSPPAAPSAPAGQGSFYF